MSFCLSAFSNAFSSTDLINSINELVISISAFCISDNLVSSAVMILGISIENVGGNILCIEQNQ